MIPADYVAKWDRRFRDNTLFEIDEADLREFKDDLLLVFATAAASEIATSLSLADAQQLALNPPGSPRVRANVLYSIEAGTWNGGKDNATIAVHGIRPGSYGPIGYTLLLGVPTLVGVDVAAGTFQPFELASTTAQLLGTDPTSGELLVLLSPGAPVALADYVLVEYTAAGLGSVALPAGTTLASRLLRLPASALNQTLCQLDAAGQPVPLVQLGERRNVDLVSNQKIDGEKEFLQTLKARALEGEGSNITVGASYLPGNLRTLFGIAARLAELSSSDGLAEGGRNLFYTSSRAQQDVYDKFSPNLGLNYIREVNLYAGQVGTLPENRMIVLQDDNLVLELPTTVRPGENVSAGCYVGLRNRSAAVRTFTFGSNVQVQLDDASRVSSYALQPGEYVTLARDVVYVSFPNTQYRLVQKASLRAAATAPGGSYSDAQAVAAAGAALVAGNAQHMGVQASVVAGQVVLEVRQKVEKVFDFPLGKTTTAEARIVFSDEVGTYQQTMSANLTAPVEYTINGATTAPPFALALGDILRVKTTSGSATGYVWIEKR